MKWFTNLFSSTLGRKLLMALTGLFLILFLLVHLIGNLQLLKDDGGLAFNVYTEFMSHNPLIQTISKVNFALILIHIVWAIMLSRQNRQSRGQEGYAISNKSSHWTSRNMGILGTIILIFLVVHLRHFFAELHWGTTPKVVIDGKEMSDAYTLVSFWFAKAWYAGLYVVCMIGLAFHLWHGFSSAFQTLGLNHVKYNPVINFVGRAFAIIVPALFALIPIMIFLK
ncbi:MAG TPA: succinate dehydrogenase [Cytophagales bacterium]|nr:succinate dehydrogenase [Cytophagales bacterium]HCR55266.1 succinate dehydrogenase [Cytophagales bacterium]